MVDIYSTLWQDLSTIGEDLVTDGTVNTFYQGMDHQYSDSTPRTLFLESGEIDEESSIYGDDLHTWEIVNTFIVRVMRTAGSDTSIIGTSDEPGILAVVESVKQSIAIDLSSWSYLDYWDFGKTTTAIESDGARWAIIPVILRGVVESKHRVS